MSVIELDSISNEDLRRRVAALISLEDWADECGACGRPSLLHRGGPCTRQEREPPDIVIKIWSDFKKRVKPILATLKADFRKEAEQSVLLDGLDRLFSKISGQNMENMSRYNENMTTLVASIKDTMYKEDTSTNPGMGTGSHGGGRIAKLTKPIKVPHGPGTCHWRLSRSSSKPGQR